MKEKEFTPPIELTAIMRQALAECYSKQGFRDYMDNAINKLTQSAAEKSKNWDEVVYYRGGIEFLKQVRYLSYNCYTDLNKLKKLAKKQ